MMFLQIYTYACTECAYVETEKNNQIAFVQSARTYPDKTRRKLKQADKSLRTKTVLSTPISALPTCKIIGF